MSRKAPIAECRLCLETAKLRESHIIPEFFYRPLYDVEHKIHVLSTVAEENRKKIQKGIWEYLLCERCEGEFGKYDTYASRVLYHDDRLAGTQDDRFLLLHGVRYKEFKLFVMSLLWRMAISSKEMFQGVSLGKYEEPLREALLAKNPLSPVEYAFTLHAVFLDGKFLHDLTMQGSPLKTERKPTFRTVIAGFLFVLHTAPTKERIDMQHMMFQSDGDLLIEKRDARKTPYLNGFFERIYTAKRQRAASRTGEFYRPSGDLAEG